MKRVLATLYILGLTMVMFAFTMLIPLVVAYVGQDAARDAFLHGFLLSIGIGGGLAVLTRRNRSELRARDGFVLVSAVGRPAAAGGDPADAVFPSRRHAAVLHRRLFRGHVRPDHHRRHRAQPGRAAAVHQPVARHADLDRRHGHPGAGRGHLAAAGRGWPPGRARRDAGPDEGRAPDAAHRQHAKALYAVYFVFPFSVSCPTGPWACPGSRPGAMATTMGLGGFPPGTTVSPTSIRCRWKSWPWCSC